MAVSLARVGGFKNIMRNNDEEKVFVAGARRRSQW